MQTRKNRKNKTFNRKNRGGGPKTKKSKSSEKKIEKIASEKKIEEIASAEKININPIPLSKSPQSPNLLLSFFQNKNEYETKKKEHEKKKENYNKSQQLNKIYGEFYIKLNELIVLFKSVDTDYINNLVDTDYINSKSVDTDYINRTNLQSIINSYNYVKAEIVYGLNLYREITHLEDQPDINIDKLITERQTYIDNIEGYKTKIDDIIERINEAKAEEIKKKEQKKQKEEEYKEKKTAKKEAKKAATKIQSLFRGRTARKKILDISPNFHLYNTNFITDPGEDVVQLNDILNDISNKIFDVIGLFTKKYPHRIILKGGKAIQVLASTILPKDVDKEKYTYLTNDIDVIVIPSASVHTSEKITEEMIDFIKQIYGEKVGSGENNQVVNGKAVKTMKIIYPFTTDEARLYNVDNPYGYKGSESLLDVTFSETETINFYKDKTWHDCHRMNEGQTICSQSIESMLYERLYYINYYINKYSKQTELIATENLFLKKIKKSFLYLLFLYTYKTSSSPKGADTIYKDVNSIQNYSEGKPMYKVLSGLINNYPEKDKQITFNKITFNNVIDKVILPNLVSNENLKKLKNIRDELIKFNDNPGLNTTIKQNVNNLIDNYYDHEYLTQKKAFVERSIKDNNPMKQNFKVIEALINEL